LTNRSSDEDIKVNPPIEKGFVKPQAIRIYVPELSREIDCSLERKENPRLMVKATHSEKRGSQEIEIVFLGKYHFEQLEYFKKNPKEWKTWGIIVLSPQAAKNLAELLLKLSRDFKSLATWV